MEPLYIKNEGAEIRNKLRMERLVSQAIKYLGADGEAENYAQWQIYCSRDNHTSIEDIVEAISIAKTKLSSNLSV